jgi:Domain of Unknown Function (DUF928)
MNPIFKINPSVNAMTIAASVMTFALTIAVASGASAENPYPGKRIAGASRTTCTSVADQNANPPMPASPSVSMTQATTKPFFTMTALVPEKDVLNSTKTTSEKPIVWVYMPYAKSKGHTFTLEVRVTDAKGESLSHNVALPENPGIMPIFLPADSKFEVGQSYGWSLGTNCGMVTPIDIQLTIDRVAAQSQSTAADPAGDFKPYDRNGIWLNAIAEVFKLNGKKPTLTPDAQQFLIQKLAGEDLKAANLDPQYLQKLAEQPIVR